LRKTIERKDITRALAMASDQSPQNWKTAYWTNFLNQDSGFFTGKEIIGALLSKLIILKVPKPRILPKIVCLNEVSDICYI